MKISQIQLILVGFAILVSSCKKNELETLNSDVQQEHPVSINAMLNNSRLQFKNETDFFNALETANQSSTENLDAWESAMGFKSVWSIFNEAQENLEDQTATSVLTAYEAEYPNLLYLNEMGDIDVKVAHKNLLRLLGPNRELYIGQGLYKFTEEGQFIVSNGDKSVLSQLESDRESTPGKCYFFDINRQVASERECGYLISDLILMNSNGNRQSHLKHFFNIIQVEMVESPGRFIVEHFVNVVGTAKKKNFLGAWVEYKTNHELEWNFRLRIANENSLLFTPQGLPTGVIIEQYNRAHAGSRTDSNKVNCSYWTKFFRATNIPYTFLSYSDPLWERVVQNRHRTQGITPSWNSFSCQ